MKVLVINGSPKGERSDTMRLTRAFLEGMDEKAEVVDTMKIDVRPCLGCFSCWRETPGVCVQKDGMDEILEKILSSDLVIWSMPLYCYGMPSNAKAVVDRLLPLSSPQQLTDEDGKTYHPVRRKSGVRMALISGCGFADREGNFDALLFQAKRCFGGEIPVILCVEAPMLGIKAAGPVTEPYLQAARKAGSEYKAGGAIGKETQMILDAPMFPPDEYRKMANRAWGLIFYLINC